MPLRNVVDVLMIGFGVSELVLALTLRSKKADSHGSDRGSLRLLWITISLAIMASFVTSGRWPHPLHGDRSVYLGAAIALMTVGLIVRWVAIVTLRRAFTVDVAIAPGQRVVTRGPYRWVRHPSYTGLLLVFVGMALSHGDAWALPVMCIPIMAAMGYRIRVEEAALVQAFGDEYEDYARRTRRLVPGLW